MDEIRRTFVALCLTAFCLPGPVLAQYHIYWGDTHGHTALSDGKGRPDDYFTWARDRAKLDFVIVTDHDFGHEAPWRMPKQDWELIQRKADEHTVDGRFVGIAGYEWTSLLKYWTPAEPLFTGPVRHFNHKTVYFPAKVDYIFSAKDERYYTPDLLAKALLPTGGLAQTAHPDSRQENDEQFSYDPAYASVIANTEMGPDVLHYRGKKYDLQTETVIRALLNRGVRTGFVAGTDTHEGKPAARTAILARELTRASLFDSLRHRRNYAITHARIVLDFQINGHEMGEEIEIQGSPRIIVQITGTAPIKEAIIVRDGAVVHTVNPEGDKARFEFVDESFRGPSYYYLRVTQTDLDEQGNPSRAWSSPIWVKAAPKNSATKPESPR